MPQTIDLLDYFTPDAEHSPNRCQMLPDRFLINRTSTGRYDVYLFDTDEDCPKDEQWLYMFGTPDAAPGQPKGKKTGKNDPTSYKRHVPPLRWVPRHPFNNESHHQGRGPFSRFENCEPYQHLDLAETLGKVSFFRRADSLWKWPSGKPPTFENHPDDIPGNTPCVRVLWMWGHGLEHREEYILAKGRGVWLRWSEHKGKKLIGLPSDKSVMNPKRIWADCPCEPWLLDPSVRWRDRLAA